MGSGLVGAGTACSALARLCCTESVVATGICATCSTGSTLPEAAAGSGMQGEGVHRSDLTYGPAPHHSSGRGLDEFDTYIRCTYQYTVDQCNPNG